MENKDYAELKEHLKCVLKTAKKLGLQVRPCGGYTMGYDINRLPDFPVGLFGALSIVEGPAARCKLGLTFEDTESLEAGFNGNYPNVSKKRKKKNFRVNKDLMAIGMELSEIVYKKPPMPRGYNPSNKWDEPADDVWSAPTPKTKKKAGQFGAAELHTGHPPVSELKLPAQPQPAMMTVNFSNAGVGGNWEVSSYAGQSLGSGLGEKIKKEVSLKQAEKEKILAKMMGELQEIEVKVAQPAPAEPAPMNQEMMEAILKAAEDVLKKKKAPVLDQDLDPIPEWADDDNYNYDNDWSALDEPDDEDDEPLAKAEAELPSFDEEE